MAKEIKQQKIKRMYLDLTVHFTSKKSAKPDLTNSNVKHILNMVKDEVYEILATEYEGEVTVKVQHVGTDFV